MPITIVFDTNYLRTFGPSAFLGGEVPSKLAAQITAAQARGDLVAIPETVRLEANHWLASKSMVMWQELIAAHQLVSQAGYRITPNEVKKPAEVDIFSVVRKAFPPIHLLEPNIEDYREAEQRTTRRLPPLPKNPDGEEFRDRLIWCQILRHSRESRKAVLVVSGDRIFHNGAASTEGIAARIEAVEGESDLDQRLDQRPHHIQAVVDQLFTFASNLQDQGVNLTSRAIIAIEELRKLNGPNGTLVQKFVLRTDGTLSIPPLVQATMLFLADFPATLHLA